MKRRYTFSIPESEIECKAIRSQGAGGQNVNKVATAIQLRFDVSQSSLSEFHKSRILASKDHHLTQDGCLIIKAQRFRTQEQNRKDALERLYKIIAQASVIQKVRQATKPSLASKMRRMDNKKRQGNTKKLRRKVDY